ncbi:MAG TPA: hypothetical protein VJ001_17335 [Rhodocyclaceae bacterium]|nr:hypothetical protein [Rhodocyclaceae bacterium]
MQIANPIYDVVFKPALGWASSAIFCIRRDAGRCKICALACSKIIAHIAA